MRNAYIHIPPAPSLARERTAVMLGLSATGFRVVSGEAPRGRAGDLLVMWNRFRSNEPLAEAFEAAGGTVLVVENGYFGWPGTLALALNDHNGAGWSPDGPDDCLSALGIELAPWRFRMEGYVLVCPSRGMGSRVMRQPLAWEADVVRDLRRHTDREIRVRPHPGNWKELPEHPDASLAQDLAGAAACVVWASGAGLRALAAGIPVIRCAPHWIAAAAASADVSTIETPTWPDRLPAFRRVAGAQWCLADVGSGLAFRRLFEAREVVAA